MASRATCDAVISPCTRGEKREIPSPDDHGHAPHDLRHPVSRRRGRLQDSRGRRQRDRRGSRGRNFARRRAAGIRERRRRRADHHLFRRREPPRHDSGARHLPAAPDAWITALERFGTMSFGDVAKSAIGYARDGFPTYDLMNEVITDHEAEYRLFPTNVDLYLPNGRPPQVGEVFVQKALAATLQHMADQEAAASARGRDAGLAAARDAFYRGDIARPIVK